MMASQDCVVAWGQTTGVTKAGVKAGNSLHHQAGKLSQEYKEQVPGKGQFFPLPIKESKNNGFFLRATLKGEALKIRLVYKKTHTSH